MTIKQYLEKEVKHNTGTDGSLVVNRIALHSMKYKPLGKVLYSMDNDLRALLKETNRKSKEYKQIKEQCYQIKKLLSMIYTYHMPLC